MLSLFGKKTHVGSWEASSSDSFSAQVSNESANELGLKRCKIFKGALLQKRKNDTWLN